MAKRGRPKKECVRLNPNGCPVNFTAYAVLKKEGTSGLYIFRKVKIINGTIQSYEDNVETLFGSQMGHLQNELEMAKQ